MVKKRKEKAKRVKRHYFYASSHTTNRVTHFRADVHLIYVPCKSRELISICSVEEEVKTLRLDTTMCTHTSEGCVTECTCLSVYIHARLSAQY